MINVNIQEFRKAIYNSRLRDKDQSEALEEFDFMEQSENYAERISLNKNRVNDIFYESFIWSKTIIGSAFWFRIFEEINSDPLVRVKQKHQ